MLEKNNTVSSGSRTNHYATAVDAIIVNFDAAIRKEFSVAAWCFRDSQGILIGISSCKIPSSDLDVAEAKAAKEAIEAVLRGWKNLLIQ